MSDKGDLAFGSEVRGDLTAGCTGGGGGFNGEVEVGRHDSRFVSNYSWGHERGEVNLALKQCFEKLNFQ